MKKIIGIIGGNGVAATNKLQELIENDLTKNGAYRDFHHPQMIIYQATQAPSRSLFLEGKGESFIPFYIEIAKKLKFCGANKIAMCCNTAHFAIKEISQKAEIDFIDLIEQVALKTKNLNVSSVGILATDGCIQHKLYDKYFNKICPEINLIYPNEEYQKMVTKGICNTKNHHRFDKTDSNENPSDLFEQTIQHLYQKGAQKIISACTDIRVSYYNPDIIDSLEILKETIIKETI